MVNIIPYMYVGMFLHGLHPKHFSYPTSVLAVLLHLFVNLQLQIPYIKVSGMLMGLHNNLRHADLSKNLYCIAGRI